MHPRQFTGGRAPRGEDPALARAFWLESRVFVLVRSSDLAGRKRVLHIVVATHGHCFDGLASAALFTRLMRTVHGSRQMRFSYHASGYGPGSNGVDPALLVGDENAILDFRFSRDKKLTWYFDHHVSAFPDATDRTSYDAHVAGVADGDRRMFHDGTYSSCTKLIVDIGAARFGLDPAPTAELVRWADMIDSASFPSAEMAVARSEPVLQLMTVVEHEGDDAFLEAMVPRVLEESIVDVALSAEVQSRFKPLQESRETFNRLVKERSKEAHDVVVVDLGSEDIEVAGKFVTYALYPRSLYSVVLTRSPSKCKVSVGYNPWSQKPRLHNIAAICERYGGGGHPVVGAVSVPASELERARAIVAEIVDELARPPVSA